MTKPMTLQDGINDPIDFDHLSQAGLIRSHQWFPALASTNTLALSDCRTCEELPHLIVADEQTAGRGRGENAWWSATGSLTFTLILDPVDWGIPTSDRPLLSLVVGLALTDACELLLNESGPPSELQDGVSQNNIRVKWPNDVYVNDRKLAGILIESLSQYPERLAFGIGLNVNNSLRNAPDAIRERATSMIDLTQRPTPRTEVLESFLESLNRRSRRLATHRKEVLEVYRDKCWLTNRQVRVINSQQEFRGKCLGIDEQGRLRLMTSHGEQTIIAGTVESVAD